MPGPVTGGWLTPSQIPDAIRSAGQRFLPRVEGTNRPTAGVFEGERIESGGRDKDLAADLDHGPLRGPPVTFYQHAESKVAARMRRDHLTSADLVVDNTVCGSNPRDQTSQWSCDRILPAILPAGSQLTVWVTRDAGRTWWVRTYRGTGERIKPWPS